MSPIRLDMYLYAEVCYPLADANDVLEASGFTLTKLREPYGDNDLGNGYSDATYLAGWDWLEEGKRNRFEGTLIVTGLPNTGQSPHLHVRYRETDEQICVITPVVYWRKANAIHGWFVKNCQDGVDECQYTEVTRGHLEALKEEAALRLQNLLGRVREARLIGLNGLVGGGLGNTDIKWWVDEARRTIDELEVLLANPLEMTFYYHSSW